MADPITQFMDRGGQIHPTPEAAIVADLVLVTGINAVMARGIVERRSEIESLFRELDVLTAAYGEDVERQQIDRNKRISARRPVVTPGPARSPAKDEE